MFWRETSFGPFNAKKGSRVPERRGVSAAHRFKEMSAGDARNRVPGAQAAGTIIE
jgi:hypothetical protein